MLISRLPAAAVLAAAILAGATSPQAAVAADSCGEFGTSVIFAESPAEAAKEAVKEEKLLFILHVSGLFEESEFT